MKYLLLILILSSCSANNLLRRAIKKGAQVTTDSVYVDVITEKTITDTTVVYNDRVVTDTIKINTVKWRTKTLINTDTIWQEVTCMPDTVRVVQRITNTIKSPKRGVPLWLFWILLTLTFIGGGYIGNKLPRLPF